ncbi:MAG: hypothetical protein AAF677_03385 [Pseudomonadota bacterium]
MGDSTASTGQPAADPRAFDTTLVTAIEPGPLEAQVLLQAESLRRLPSPIAEVPFMAVQPRFGTRLGAASRKALSDLGVEYVYDNVVGPYAFYGIVNKAAGLSIARRRASTPYLTLVDGDLLWLRPPAWVVDPAADFMARAGEADLGTTLEDDTAGYWRQVTQRFGLSVDDFGWMTSKPEGVRIKEYYSSGIASARREGPVFEQYFAILKRLFDERIASRRTHVYHHDQMALTLAAVKHAAVRVEYPWAMNYNFNMLTPEDVDIRFLSEISVLHYHGSFYDTLWPKAEPYLGHLPQDAQTLVRASAPFAIRLTAIERLVRKALTTQRNKRMKRHLSRCDYL